MDQIKITSFIVRLDRDDCCIVIDRNRAPIYDVNLKLCRTSAEVLDYIIQISRKSWCSADVLWRVIMLMNEALEFQRTLCSGGIERGPIDPVKIMKENR